MICYATWSSRSARCGGTEPDPNTNWAKHAANRALLERISRRDPDFGRRATARAELDICEQHLARWRACREWDGAKAAAVVLALRRLR